MLRRSRLKSRLAFPISLPIAYVRCWPNRAGVSRLSYRLPFMSPSAWMPAVCVNTFSPTIGLFGGTRRPENTSTSLLTSESARSSTDVLMPA